MNSTISFMSIDRSSLAGVGWDIGIDSILQEESHKAGGRTIDTPH
jgi:hypothetical protein